MNRPKALPTISGFMVHVENFGPSLPAGKYRIWKASWAYHKPWCLTTFIGTYRFKDWDSAVAYMKELESPSRRSV